MLSIVILARNVREGAVNCVRSVAAAVQKLHIESAVELLLIDDASDPGMEVAPAFAELRTQINLPIRIVRFAVRQHYTKALTHAFSLASGESILFVSHDMIVTPTYISTLLAVAATDPSIGIVRGTSPYVDAFPQYVITPPTPIRTFDDVDAFSAYVAKSYGLTTEVDKFLTGDSMLITAETIKRVGVFDPQYFGYFGDIDFGLRVRRAGLKMVCAKGAWLLHEGAAFYKQAARGGDMTPVMQARMQVVNAAYVVFRQKWDQSLPPTYPGTAAFDFDKMLTLPAPAAGEFQPKLIPDPSICQII